MITPDTINFIEPSLKFSIKAYFPLKERMLLYDALVFSSLTSQTKMFCSDADADAFATLLEFCERTGISLEAYLSCAYNYIQKYTKPGHRLGLGYFLNEAVVDYCSTRVSDSTGDSLLVQIIKDDLLSTEKAIRAAMSDYGIDYNEAFKKLLKKRQLSNYFLAYKKFCGSELVAWYKSDYFDNLVTILEPFFTYILAKNHIYTPYKITEWNNSKLEDYAFCPVYFKDRYITNELVDSSLGNEATNQGTAVHSIFETIIDRYVSNKTKDLSGIAERYFKSKAFTSITEDISDHVPYIVELFKDKSSILHKLITPENRILTEHMMKAELGNHTTFFGTADLIIVEGTTAHILDYKTSKLDPKYLPKNNKKYTKQLSLYAKMFMKNNPEITKVTATLIYTRGLIQPLDVNLNIDVEREREIASLKKDLKSGVVMPNSSSCFLCRHPNCKFRAKQSIWDENGFRRNHN